MAWSKLIEAQLVVSMNSNYLAFWNFLAQFSYRLEQNWLISPFEVFILFAIEESYKIWDALYSESLSTISCYLNVHSNKYKVWIFV